MQKVLIPLVAALIGLAGMIGIQAQFKHTPIKDTITFDFNDGFASFSPDFLKATSFGYSRFVSSLLWMRFLQHTPPAGMGSDDVSWIFLDLLAISEIDPDFYPVYLQGAIFMAVITEDIKGSTYMMEKAVRRYPNYWRIRAQLAFHYENNLGDLKRAAEQFEAAALLPGSPAYFKALAVTTYTKAEDESIKEHKFEFPDYYAPLFFSVPAEKPPPDYSIQLIQRMLASAKDKDVKERLREKLDKLLRKRQRSKFRGC